MKVAKWEIRRNMKNKSFVIGMVLTPVMFILFSFLGSLFGDSEDEATKVLVRDELNVYSLLEETADAYALNLEFELTELNEEDIKEKIETEENMAYLEITGDALQSEEILVLTSKDISSQFQNQLQLLSEPLKVMQLGQLGLTQEQLAAISKPILFTTKTIEEADATSDSEGDGGQSVEDTFEKAGPGIFAGIILFSIVVTGMMIFTSASQEKKDKIAEIVLSSVTPEELMQGKIIGYFVLGMIQTLIILAFGIPYALWQFDFPVLQYLLVPETLLFVFIAVLGYLLFAALFVGIGATMADMSTAGNFQGMVMMLPFLPLVFLGPVIGNPSGLWAQIASYIPFSSPGILILRLSMLDEWPWLEIIISLAILLVSIWLFMKLAGKIFKVGILLYGKNATPAEIWKWIRA